MVTGTDHLPSPVAKLRVGLRAAGELAGLTAMAVSGDPVAMLALGSSRVDQYLLYEQIRARGPLVRSRTGVYATPARDLTEQILRDPRFGKQRPSGFSTGIELLTDHASGTMSGSFLDLDPPEHTRLRRVVAPAFRPKLIRGFAPRVEQSMATILDDVRRSGPTFDLMADVAQRFPIAVISDLLGITGGDARRFAKIGSDVGQSLDGVRTVADAVRLREGSDELDVMFARLADNRRRHPGEDIISLLVSAEDHGQVSAADLTATCGLLLLAGFETTANLIGNAVVLLQKRPDLWVRLATEEALAAAVVEETLRLDAPVQLTIRFAKEPLVLAGTPLSTGTGVLPLIGAANRDPDVYRDPARFRTDRTGEPEHLSFAAGVHYCLGAVLARLEGAVALRTLARELPRLRLLPGARRRRGSAIRGFATLPAIAE